jgi:hypothetical protein
MVASSEQFLRRNVGQIGQLQESLEPLGAGQIVPISRRLQALATDLQQRASMRIMIELNQSLQQGRQRLTLPELRAAQQR